MVAFDVDDHTLEVIAGLRDAFGVNTNAAVIRKALALAKVAAERADENGTITLARPEGDVVVLLKEVSETASTRDEIITRMSARLDALEASCEHVLAMLKRVSGTEH